MAGSTIKDILDRGEAPNISGAFLKLAFGTLLGALGTPVRQVGIVVYLNESTAITGKVTAVYATAGGATGALVVMPYDPLGVLLPAAGECALEFTAAGTTIVHTAAADAVTAIDVIREDLVGADGTALAAKLAEDFFG